MPPVLKNQIFFRFLPGTKIQTKILKTILYYFIMSSRVFDVSYRNEARRVTVNDNTKIGYFIEKAIGIYDLNIDDVTGLYFVDKNI
jgi:hypothetical protein